MIERIKLAFEAGFAAGFNTGDGYDSSDANFDFAKAMAEAWEAHRPILTAPPPQYAGSRPLPHRRRHRPTGPGGTYGREKDDY